MRALIRGSSGATRLLVSGLTLAFACATCGVRPSPSVAALRGASTAGAAARIAIAEEDSVPRTLAGWRPTTGFVASAAPGDTTDVDFPEDEEQRHEHLYRDIGIFLVVSAFVGYFIVKVFLQGDTDESPPPDNGKDIPGP